MRTSPALVLLTSTLLAAAAAAGCSSSASDDGTSAGGSRASSQHVSAPPQRARLVVNVTLSGGPIRRDGTMALSDSPATGDTVRVIARTGRTWRAPVGHDGDARFTLPPGQYKITGTTCADVQRIELAANGSARLKLHCDVP